MTLKTAVFAPMPSPRVRAQTRVNPGALRSCRLRIARDTKHSPSTHLTLKEQHTAQAFLRPKLSTLSCAEYRISMRTAGSLCPNRTPSSARGHQERINAPASAVDSFRGYQRKYGQCALGRPLSAAREMTSTQPVVPRLSQPFFQPVLQRTSGNVAEGKSMSRQLTPKSTLDNLKKEAKRWLKALRANDLEARTRLQRAWPKAPANPACAISNMRSRRTRPCELGGTEGQTRRVRSRQSKSRRASCRVYGARGSDLRNPAGDRGLEPRVRGRPGATASRCAHPAAVSGSGTRQHPHRSSVRRHGDGPTVPVSTTKRRLKQR